MKNLEEDNPEHIGEGFAYVLIVVGAAINIWLAWFGWLQ